MLAITDSWFYQRGLQYQVSPNYGRSQLKTPRHRLLDVPKGEQETDAQCFCHHICQRMLPKKCFTTTQLQAAAYTRACKDCVRKKYLVGHEDGVQCDECGYFRGHGCYSLKSLYGDGVPRVCEFCLNKRREVPFEFFRFVWNAFWCVRERGQHNGVGFPTEQEIDEFWKKMDSNAWWVWKECGICLKHAKQEWRDHTGEHLDLSPTVPEQQTLQFCFECEQRRPRNEFSKTQLSRASADRRCRCCTEGPDHDDPAMKRDGLWFDFRDTPETAWQKDVWDDKGRMRPKYQQEGIVRLMSLKYIHHTVNMGGQSYPEDELMRVVRWRGKYWSVDNSLLRWYMEQFNGDKLVKVRYFHYVNWFGIGPFAGKLATLDGGETATVTLQKRDCDDRMPLSSMEDA